MSQWSEADRYLLEGVRKADGEAWSQLVSKYQGRLLAFARGQRVPGADAEDLVQDTFLRFLRGLDAFRGEASLETYLFLLLRRRIIESVRGRKVRACAAGDAAEQADSSMSMADDSASWYVRRDEQLARERAALAQAVLSLVEKLRTQLNFRDLQLVEMLFYAQMRNKDIGEVMGLDEKYVALLKHRWVKDLRSKILRALGPGGIVAALDDEHGQASMLSDVWDEHRPSCPKRTTLGGYHLGTLDPAWTAYVKFHVETLGCRFCAANLDDLKKETAAAESDQNLRGKVMQSTVGFFRRP